MSDAREQLGEMAQALARGRARLAEINERIDEIKPSFDALVNERVAVKRAIETIEDGMATTRKAYATKTALSEKTIEYAEPLVVLVEAYSGAEPWFLCAVGTDGTGLYLHTPKKSHRYAGKSYAILGSEKTEGEARGARQGAGRTSDSMLAAGLISYDTRGRGSFGAGTGSVVPLPPPGGGRWRWIKVAEQDLLTAGGSDGTEDN